MPLKSNSHYIISIDDIDVKKGFPKDFHIEKPIEMDMSLIYIRFGNGTEIKLSNKQNNDNSRGLNTDFFKK
ncbi:hypothetical protein [Marivirga sp.]|uniref:hypothetical protein n=1 Tax=Marivirga sp. TaxID=2018662 RepID=UPI003DA78063